ncbi:hypothetical protein ACTI_43840 [Actinoplanes sp. OR16]|uniref:isoprenylcysteine carboxylmethyltransferase family protein n=1 Tax=Actinoplanes sp. OR16 TaxID=946334 RepID=UPI000F6CC712|nr:isoprenylcysteine carboxylmethyltransferase family protein [Actinoplanes sp. OR16]BBH67699.1 hypothetical protein ACTI_43840 [Actinoplanes sp. OR16]
MTTARYLSLLIPVAALLVAARRERERAGAALAFIASATGLAVLHEIATAAGWWTFATVDGAYHGFPIDLWLGWAVLWGPVPVLLRRLLPLPVALGLLLWIDAIAMPALDPLLRLGPHWLLGEALGLIAVALPAQLLGRWTATRSRLMARVLLQVGLFGVLLLWLIPSVAFTLGDGSWDRLLDAPLFLLGQLAFLLAVPALAAVREFALRGGGTPFPWDPPVRLVTTGVYAYLANPMQLSAISLLLLMAAAARSLSLAVAAIIAGAFAGGLAAASEHHDLLARYEGQYRSYRAQVRDWWPRTRPSTRTPGSARLWLDDDCGPCSGVRDLLLRSSPVGLTILPASSFDGPVLWRARYEADDGHVASGVAAVARGLGHGTVLQAYAGWLLILPGLNQSAQLVVDALIAPPHPAGAVTVGKNGR